MRRKVMNEIATGFFGDSLLAMTISEKIQYNTNSHDNAVDEIIKEHIKQ